MRRETYLNVILTINAVLLAVVLWVQVAERPLLAETALAQPSRIKIPNANDQRFQMINELKNMSKSLEVTRKLLESGKIKVEVTNLDQKRSDR